MSRTQRRHPENLPRENLHFAGVDFDPATGEVSTAAGRSRLACQPALILSALARHPGEVMTRAELQRIVWDETTHVDYEQNLNFCIREIRKALGDSAREPRFVETLPKRGYRWVAPIKSPAIRPTRRRWPVVATVATALVVGTALGHEISASPLHERAVDWAHRTFQVSPGSCPFG